MKVLSNLRLSLLFALLLFVIAPRAGAQGLLLTVLNSPNPVQTNATLTHTITLVNGTGLTLSSLYVTNTLPGSVLLVTNSTTRGNAIITNSSRVVFFLGSLIQNDAAVMTVVTIPTAGGLITNVFTANDLVQTNFIVTSNIVTRVIGALPTPADLSVSISPPPTNVLVNDWITLGVNVSNLATNSVSGVLLTNSFSPGVRLIGVSPSNETFTAVGSNVIVNVGTVAGSATQTVQLRVVPTNTGPLTLTSTVSTTGVVDVNRTNNTASADIIVQPLVTGALVVSNVSAMVFNPQDSLMEQTVRLVNVGASNVPSARVIVNGLTNWLYNAVGTNSLGTTNGFPFVEYTDSLDPGESVDLLLEYVIPSRTAIDIDSSNYVAVAIAPVDLGASTNSTLLITNIVQLTSGSILIEFPAIKGRNYTILYSSDASFSTNTLAAQPSFVAQADKVQWIDDGPPKTVSPPTSVSSRFYRVRLNP